jgi:putative membrane protein insertion efficiency factor
MFFKKLFFFFILMGLLSQTQGYGGEGRWEEPWGKQPPGSAARGPAPYPSTGQRVTEGLIRIFQKYISPVDGDRCPCYPTCSQYGVEAIRKHGALVGTVMTIDRLIHESDEIRRVPVIRIYGSYRYYDPVENNDFWWNKK